MLGPKREAPKLDWLERAGVLFGFGFWLAWWGAFGYAISLHGEHIPAWLNAFTGVWQIALPLSALTFLALGIRRWALNAHGPRPF